VTPAARPAGERVVAVVVTFNRRQLLLESLAAIEAQEVAPDVVLVIDNASTDGTAEAVRTAHPHVRLTTLSRNTGGAGGFAFGLATALADGADLVWLMDDDTVPRAGALGALLTARAGYLGPPPVVLASRVVWTDGRAHPMNTPRRKPLVCRAEVQRAARVGCEPIRSASFVSILIDAEACRERGLPVADFFLWNDDFEFTARLLRGRTGLLCPDSTVVHKTGAFGRADAAPGERFFYEVRNKVWTITRSRALAPAERVLYAGTALVRWGIALARSHDRRTLTRALLRGLGTGLRHRPRPNEDVLAWLPHTAPR
jgi:GT2 family glycosyltransferase